MSSIDRQKEAKRLRESGLSFKEVGARLGVSATGARYMVHAFDRHERTLEWHKKNPRWDDGLSGQISYLLTRAKLDGRDSCAVFLADDLKIWRGSVVFDDGNGAADWWRYTTYRFPLSMVDEIRAWLGSKPYPRPRRLVTEKDLDKARRLLESSGWRVDPPAP